MATNSSNLAWLIGVAIASAGAMAIAQEAALPELWQSSSGLWNMSDGPLANGDREVMMERIAEEGSRYRYEALPGSERRISREGCEGTEQRFWLVGGRNENLALARVALMAAARPSANCSTDEAAAALAGFDAAFGAIEDRLQAHPYEDASAWRMDSDGMMGTVRTRTEGGVSIEYIMVGQTEHSRVRLAFRTCGGRPRQFERQFGNGSRRDGQVAAASAALREALEEGQRTCGLNPAASERLSRGFGEVVGADFFDPELMTDTNSQ